MLSPIKTTVIQSLFNNSFNSGINQWSQTQAASDIGVISRNERHCPAQEQYQPSVVKLSAFVLIRFAFRFQSNLRIATLLITVGGGLGQFFAPSFRNIIYVKQSKRWAISCAYVISKCRPGIFIPGSLVWHVCGHSDNLISINKQRHETRIYFVS